MTILYETRASNNLVFNPLLKYEEFLDIKPNMLMGIFSANRLYINLLL